jgi:hypothetical protein
MIQYVLRVTSVIILYRPTLFTLSENDTSDETESCNLAIFLSRNVDSLFEAFHETQK